MYLLITPKQVIGYTDHENTPGQNIPETYLGYNYLPWDTLNINKLKKLLMFKVYVYKYILPSYGKDPRARHA